MDIPGGQIGAETTFDVRVRFVKLCGFFRR
jgi:hypothetical protein